MRSLLLIVELYLLGESAVHHQVHACDAAGSIYHGQGVFAGHVNKPVSKKQSDLTVYFLSDTVVAQAAQNSYKCAALHAAAGTFLY
jgi:hypothetical protein